MAKNGMYYRIYESDRYDEDFDEWVDGDSTVKALCDDCSNNTDLDIGVWERIVHDEPCCHICGQSVVTMDTN